MMRRRLPAHPFRFYVRCLRLCATLVLLANLCAAAAAQSVSPPAGSQANLLSVEETGSRQYSSAQVAALSGLQIGAPVNHDAIQAGADRLAHSGLFSSVRYQYASDVGGVRVTFTLEDAPSFPVSFDNFPWFTNDELSRALDQAGLPFHGMAPATGTILDAMSQALEKTLATRGVHAAVTHQLTVRPGANQSTLLFSVQGADLNVGAVQFTDPLAANDPTIQNQLSSLVGKPFSREAIERFDFEHVRPVYLSDAYLRVQFGSPKARFNANPLGPPPQSVVVIVPITPGAQYAWGGVVWNGNHAYTTSDLNAVVQAAGLSIGQPADGMKILALWQSVNIAYGHRGYLDATVTPAEVFDNAARRAVYHVQISEGQQYHMGNLVLTGLSIDAERRIRKAWRIPQGQIFDRAFFNYFLAQGIASALRGSAAAQDKIGHFLQKNQKQATVDVMLDFE